MLVWAKRVIKFCHLRCRGSTASTLWWRHSSPLHPVICLDRRHSCHMSAFQCASEPAEECEVIFMCLNTVSWLTWFEFWPGQRGFLWDVPVLRRQFWNYYLILHHDPSLPYSQSLPVGAALPAITVATLIEPQINRHVYEVSIPRSLKLFVWIIYMDFPPNKLHIFCRVIWSTLFRSWQMKL
jgi:hypothetical protein